MVWYSLREWFICSRRWLWNWKSSNDIKCRGQQAYYCASADQNFTGSSLTPAIIVKDDGTALTLGTHYSLAYANNINAGTATVTITGMGNDIGTKTQTFSIAFPTLSIISGNNQTGPVNQMLGSGPILKVLNADGSPAASISLTATASAGQISRPVLSNLANSYSAGGRSEEHNV